MHRSALAALVGMALTGTVLGLAGCSGGSGSSAPDGSPSSPGPASETPAASPAPSTSPAPTLATLPAARCLTGTWSLVRFVGASKQTYGTGEGGDLTVGFRGRGYTLRGAGQEPVTVTLAGQTADLFVDGSATGSYRLRGDTATFAQQKTTGSGLVGLGRRQQKLSMSEVTSVVGLKGNGKVACTAQAMTITLSSVRLELGRA